MGAAGGHRSRGTELSTASVPQRLSFQAWCEVRAAVLVLRSDYGAGSNWARLVARLEAIEVSGLGGVDVMTPNDQGRARIRKRDVAVVAASVAASPVLVASRLVGALLHECPRVAVGDRIELTKVGTKSGHARPVGARGVVLRVSARSTGDPRLRVRWDDGGRSKLEPLHGDRWKIEGTWVKGDRIELTETSRRRGPRPGTRGTVTKVHSSRKSGEPRVRVRWDNGGSSRLEPSAGDRWRSLS